MSFFSALEFKALTTEFAKLLAAAEQVPAATPTAAVTTSYHGLTTAEALRRAFDSVYARDSFAFHFEDDAGVMTCGSLSFGPGHALRFERAALDAGARDGLLEILANGLVNKACHDAKRALYLINCPPHSGVPATGALASGHDFRFESLRDDVHLAGYLLDPGIKAERLTLTGLAETYLGLEAGAVQALDPADVVSRLQAVLRPKLESEGLLTVYETMELPLTPVLYDVECAGVRIDPAPLVELEAELRRELERLTTEIYELAGEPFNINSPQQVADIFEKLNYETSKKDSHGPDFDQRRCAGGTGGEV